MPMLSDFKLKTDAIAAEHQRHCCMRSRSCAWVGFCLLSNLSIASASSCIEQTGKSSSPLILGSPEGFTAPLGWPHFSIFFDSREPFSLIEASQSKHCVTR